MLDDVAYVDPPPGAETERTRVAAGDVLLSVTADLGRAAVVPKGLGRAHISQHLAILRTQTFEPRFLAAFLSLGPGRHQITSLDRGGVKSGLNFDNVRSLRVPLPPLPEQRRIADILDKADAIRRKRKQAITLTEDLLRSAFLDMFGDPVTNPRGWPQGRVEDLCSHVVDCPHTTPTYEGELRPHPCVRTADLQGGFFDWSTTRHVSETEYRTRVARLQPEAGDVFYTREGERYGIAAILPPGVAACLGQRMMLLRPNPVVATSEFLWASMNSPGVYRQATAEVGGSTSPHVNVKSIRRFVVCRPPVELQRKYGRACESAARARAAQQVAELHADKLFSALVQRAFGGQRELGAGL
ncbi:MAG: restriction endonuclease subunit S [Polyangiaceae bacterium]